MNIYMKQSLCKRFFFFLWRRRKLNINFHAGNRDAGYVQRNMYLGKVLRIAVVSIAEALSKQYMYDVLFDS
jgi:hypothetical protein